MAAYHYTAYNEEGKLISGELEAESRDAAFEMVGERGLIPETVKKKSGSRSGSSLGLVWMSRLLNPVSARELILFTKQFKTLFQAGVSIIQILQIMEAQTESKRLKTVLDIMAENIRGGASLHQAFSAHKDIFSPLYCAMIRAGESSGSLPDVLERLIFIIEHEHKVKSDIKAALRYPAIVLFMLTGAFFFLLTVIIPKFMVIFEKVGLELPLPTKICIQLYTLIHHYWLIGLIVIIAGIFSLLKYFKTESGRFQRDRFVMKVPLIGPLFVKTAMSRFASIFSILQSSGISVLDSMDILAETIANAAITREFFKIKELLTEGRGISAPLKSARYFTPMVVNMIAIGEESGNLDEMLREVAEHYDAEVEFSTKALSDSIAPILTIGLAAVVGFFAMAIFLPMWDLTKMVK